MRTSTALWMIVALSVVVTKVSTAQSPAPPTSAAKPIPRSSDGKPDLSGVWGGPAGLQHIGRDLPGNELPYTQAGRDAYQHNLTKEIDPSALCNLQGVPRANLSGQPFEIFQRPGRLAFLYERTTAWRIIPADGRPLPTDFEPAYFGNAVAHWEGDTLVIESIGFKGTQVWSDETAHPHSDALRLTERWSRPEYDRLFNEVTIDDPKYYTHPFKFSRSFQLLPYELFEQACNENNIDQHHIGPGLGTTDGTRGYTKKPGQP